MTGTCFSVPYRPSKARPPNVSDSSYVGLREVKPLSPWSCLKYISQPTFVFICAHRLGPPESMLTQISRNRCEANGASACLSSSTEAIRLVQAFTSRLMDIVTSSAPCLRTIMLAALHESALGPSRQVVQTRCRSEADISPLHAADL